MEASSLIAYGEALKNGQITRVAEKCDVSPAALCIWYVIQLRTVALPKTADPQHMKENAAIEDADMETLNYVAYSHIPAV